ncbi:MAG: Mur ligase family protein, partial [Fimbriimonadaceae bacterium]
VGVVTVIGHAHLEMVGSRSGIARAKGELLESLPADGLAVGWAEDEFRHELRGYAGDREWATFGESEGADARLVGCEAVGWGRSRARYIVDGKPVSAEIPVVGRHMARNAAAALLVASRLGADLEAAAAGLAETELPAMRMQAVEWKGATILVDAYNAAPGSFAAALETAGENRGDGRLWVVMGEMRELGELTQSAHAEVGRAIAASGPYRVGFIGEQTRHARAACAKAGVPESHMVDLADLDAVAAFLSDLSPGDVALVKGSRALELEKALAAMGVSW